MSLRVRKIGGILVEYKEQGIMFDPTRNTHRHPTFITHAHSDHTAAFKHPEREKFATKETYNLLDAMGWKRLANFKPIKIGETKKIEDIEVRAHNSGHILGSVQYEVNTPEGTVLFTGDLGTEKTYTMKPAQPVRCDILVIETTFGSPLFNFPTREDIAVEIYNWAVNAVIQGNIPTFKTDSIGNAQEIISILNQYTNLSVITYKSVSRVTEVYRNHGFNLDTIDSNTKEGMELLDNRKCVLVAPKGSKPKRENLEIALASGWAAIMGKNRVAFPLSDHADFKSLLSFISKCKPKRVLTFHGGKITKDFHKHVKKTLGIPSSPLTTTTQTINGPKLTNEARYRACSEHLIRIVKIPGFIYQQNWLIKEMRRQGFTQDETEKAISFLLEKEVLKSSYDGISLN